MSNRKPRGYWTLERCMDDAQQYSGKFEWRKASKGAYDAALRQGWLDQCHAHMAPKYKQDGHWTLERCMTDAASHKTRSEWKLASGAAYDSAQSNGWLGQCCEHMRQVRNPKGYWTLDRCMKDAARFNTRTDWLFGSTSGYHTARSNGWLDKCCEHMSLGVGGTDNDVVYIWRDAGSDLHKIGVTSDRIGERRISDCKNHNGMDPRIVFMLKVDDARAVESELLKLGTDPELDSSIDGYTEFRRLTDAELGRAVSIAYEAAIAA